MFSQHRCAPIHAPGGNGLLISPPDRLKQLINHQSIHDFYIVSDQPFARGQFASVRECTHRETGEKFAAKVLKKRRRLCDIYHEIAVLDALSAAPNIIGLQQVFETTAEIIIVLELAVGGELQTTLDVESTLAEEEVVRLMQQILHGLQLLHRNSIAHLDLKPQNILLTGPFDTGQVKLCDFGISRLISPNVDLREIMGTADYMAPEILNYESLSLATDMWSVGVLSYVLLTGCAPFTGCRAQETYCNITSQPLDFPDQLFGHVTSCAQNFISQLLLKNPRDRLTVDQCLRHPWIAQQLQLPKQLVGCDSFHEKVRKDSGFNSPGVSDVEMDEVVEDDGEEEDGGESSTELTSGCGQRSRKLNPASPGMSVVPADGVCTLRRPTTARTAELNLLGDCSGATGTSGTHRCVTNSASETHRCAKGSEFETHRCVTHSESETHRCVTHSESEIHRCVTHSVSETHRCVIRSVSQKHGGLMDPVSETFSCLTAPVSETFTSCVSDSLCNEKSRVFCFNSLSVSHLTDRIWDCFDVHAFRTLPFRPWQNVCTGVADKARENFLRKSLPLKRRNQRRLPHFVSRPSSPTPSQRNDSAD